MYTAQTRQATDKAAKFPYFIYRPAGLPRDQIDEIVDVSDVWDVKLEAMQVHESQKHDYERIIKMREGLPKEEYFLVRKRD